MSRDDIVFLLKAPQTDKKADEYSKVLQAEGFKACSVPALSFTFINLEKLRTALLSDTKYSCLVLTSPRSVAAVQKALQESDEWQVSVCTKWTAKPTFVVGHATATAVTNLGLRPLGADTGNASSLAPYIVSELKKIAVTDMPVLMPCGQLSLETLPNALQNEGIPVECLIVYETVADSLLADNLKASIETQGCPQYIVFFSPSIVRSSQPILENLGLLQSSVQLVAIGPTTEAAMTSMFGRCNATAVRPTPQHLCDTIRNLSKT